MPLSGLNAQQDVGLGQKYVGTDRRDGVHVETAAVPMVCYLLGSLFVYVTQESPPSCSKPPAANTLWNEPDLLLWYVGLSSTICECQKRID